MKRIVQRLPQLRCISYAQRSRFEPGADEALPNIHTLTSPHPDIWSEVWGSRQGKYRFEEGLHSYGILDARHVNANFPNIRFIRGYFIDADPLDSWSQAHVQQLQALAASIYCFALCIYRCTYIPYTVLHCTARDCSASTDIAMLLSAPTGASAAVQQSVLLLTASRTHSRYLVPSTIHSCSCCSCAAIMRAYMRTGRPSKSNTRVGHPSSQVRRAV